MDRDHRSNDDQAVAVQEVFVPAVYEIRWLPNGAVETFYGSRGNYYEVSESDRLDLHCTPVWCRRCAKITEGEQLPTLEATD